MTVEKLIEELTKYDLHRKVHIQSVVRSGEPCCDYGSKFEVKESTAYGGDKCVSIEFVE